MADQSETRNEQDNGGRREQEQSQQTVIEYLLEKKYDTCLWLIRFYILFSAVCYVIPVLGIEFGQSSFKRVLLGSAAISALRLHQRMPRIQLTMEFAKQLILEDSFHYFIYSVLFLLTGAATIVLIPIVIFATMHAASFTSKVINVSGSSNWLVIKINQVVSKLAQRETQQHMLLFIATSEILVFFVAVVMLVSGQGSLLVPFFYYRFLQLRYSSRRNPYSRMAFNQLRVTVEYYANHPKCPGICTKVLNVIISLALRLAPSTS